MDFTEEQIWALEKFDALAAQVGSQNKACSVVGIKAAIISPLRKGTYQGDANAQFNKLISYFRTKEAAAAVSPPQMCEYVPTSISTKIMDVIRNCQLKGGLAVACGAAGIGKTRAAKQYVHENPNDAIYLAVNPCLTSLRSFLRVLSNKLNVTERTIDEMWMSITNKLRDGMVIIVDEAQHLTIKTMEALRAFTDYFAERGQTLGVVFIGNTETITVTGGKKRAEFAQITNRTRQRKVYTTDQIRREDIQLLFPDLKDEKMQIDFLLKIARTPQAIRGAVNLYSNAVDNNNVTYEGLVAMAKHMEMVI
ncbi:MAG: AAA family ATPase [Burkholderiales bacterium]